MGKGENDEEREEEGCAFQRPRGKERKKGVRIQKSMEKKRKGERWGANAACGTGQLAAKKESAKHTLEEPVHKSKTPMSQNDSNQSCAGDWFPPKKRT